jgi:hypothetical protein
MPGEEKVPVDGLKGKRGLPNGLDERNRRTIADRRPATLWSLILPAKS